MNADRFRSWGRFPPAGHRGVAAMLRDGGFPQEAIASGPALPFGNGRSYGDSCLNPGGMLIDCRGLDQITAFDTSSGRLRCEAGVLLGEILGRVVPAGWFLAVTPGTQFVTVGGAIANDVHGKNHHRRGTFGNHVTRFDLVRSDGSRLSCSPEENSEMFRATIGGMGLTGVIVEAELQLMPVASARIDQDSVRFDRLADFFTMSAESDSQFEYGVAWIDSLARGSRLGRGHYIRGNHAQMNDGGSGMDLKPPRRVPFQPPVSLLNRATLAIFNEIYYRRQVQTRTRKNVPFRRFFYPLDGIGDWNRLYGPRGLLQHQSVLPEAVAPDAVAELLTRSQKAGLGSFLTVLKMFGSKQSRGLLSFPRPGATLTLDFANSGEKTIRLLDELDCVVVQAGGAVNPYKDARMSPETFQSSFPHWRDILPHADPRLSSGFWRRVTGLEAQS